MSSDDAEKMAGSSRQSLHAYLQYLLLFGVILSLLSCGKLNAQENQQPSESAVDSDFEGSDKFDNPTSYALEVKPESCVALHKGQRCFIRVTLSWTSPGLGEYCIFEDPGSKALHCSSSATGQLVVNYASASSIVYQLRESEADQPVAFARVSTSWVYRTGRRSSSSWRIF
jgi:hypothetical protein